MPEESLGQLNLDIKIDWKKVNSSLDRVNKAVSKSSSLIKNVFTASMRGLASISTSILRGVVNIFTNAFNRIVQIIKRAMLVSAAAISGFLLYATKSAIDIEEVESLFEHSFKNMSGSVRSWSDSYSRSVKTNKYDSLSLLTTMFNMTKAMGLTKEEAIDTSKKILEVSNDLKSAYNLKGAVAFEKIRSAIAGQSRPLQELGIIVNEAAKKEYAYKNGLAKSGEELSSRIKVLATLGLVMESTEDIQGDMLRTLTSSQNSIRAIIDGIKEWTVDQGNLVKSSFVFRSALKNIVPIISSVKDSLTGVLEKSLISLDNHFANRINQEKWIKGLRVIGNTIVKVKSEITKIISSFTEWLSVSENQEKIKNRWENLKIVISKVWEVIGKLSKKFVDFVRDGDKVKDLKKSWEGFSFVIKSIYLVLDRISWVINKINIVLLRLFGQAEKGFMHSILVVAEFGLALGWVLNPIRSITWLWKGFTAGAKSSIPIASLFTKTLIFLEKKLISVGSLFFRATSAVLVFFEALGLVTTASAVVVTAAAAAAAAIGWIIGGWIVDGIVYLYDRFESVRVVLDAIAMAAANAWIWISKLWGGGGEKDVNEGRLKELNTIKAMTNELEKQAAIEAYKAKYNTKSFGSSASVPPISTSISTSIPTSSSISSAHAVGNITAGEKAMLEQLKILTKEVENQPLKTEKMKNIDTGSVSNSKEVL